MSLLLAATMAGMMAAGVDLSSASIDDDERYRIEVLNWRGDRAERLKKTDSWLTLIGLHWLKQHGCRIAIDDLFECGAVVKRNDAKPLQKRLEQLYVVGSARGAQRSPGLPVKAALSSDDARPPRRSTGKLQCIVYRLATTIGEIGILEIAPRRLA